MTFLFTSNFTTQTAICWFHLMPHLCLVLFVHTHCVGSQFKSAIGW